MCKNLRAVAAALIAMSVAVASAPAQDRPDDPPATNPFADVLSNGPKAARKDRPVKPPPRRPPGEAAEARIDRALRENTSLNFTEAELGEVVAHLKREHDIEVQLDRQALEEYDLGSDTLVTCVVKGISLGSALKLMLRPLGLTYTIDHEVLLITTEEAAAENRKTKVYDVADLVTYRGEKGELWTNYEPLIDTVTAAIRPDSWDIMGGMGSVTGNDLSTAKVLVVTQTEEVHSRIARLLHEIRRVAARTPGGQPPLRQRPAKDDTPPSPPGPFLTPAGHPPCGASPDVTAPESSRDR